MNSTTKLSTKHEIDEGNLCQDENYSAQLYEYSDNPEVLREMYSDLQYLNKETITLLRDMNIPKDFFIKLLKPKIRLIRDLRERRFSVGSITEAVSKVVQSLVVEYEATGLVENRLDLSNDFVKDEQVKPVKKVEANIFRYQPAALFDVKSRTK